MPPGVVVTFAAPAGNTFTNPGAAVWQLEPGPLPVPVVPALMFLPARTSRWAYSQVFLTNPGPTAAIPARRPPMSPHGHQTVIRG